MRIVLADLMSVAVRIVLTVVLMMAWLNDVAGVRTWFTELFSSAVQAAIQ